MHTFAYTVRRLAILATAIAATLCTACSFSFDGGSDHASCTEDFFCPAGFQCTPGGCVLDTTPGDPPPPSLPADAGNDTPPVDPPPPPPAAMCGDGLAGGDEQCDDGNPDDTDGCLTDCRAARCGDGLVRAGVEQCDDANAIGNDGCTTACLECAENGAEVSADVTGHCYELEPAARLFDDALAACEDLGEHLATFVTEAEWQQVQTRIDLGNEDAFIGLAGGAPNLFSWVTGETLGFAAWDATEPNGDGAGVRVNVETMLWRDTVPTRREQSICERDAPVLRPTDNHAYRVGHAGASAAASDVECAAAGGHLVTLDDAGEAAFLSGVAIGTFWIGPAAACTVMVVTGPGSALALPAACESRHEFVCEID